MSDNYTIRDSVGNILTIKAKDTTGSGGPLAPQSTPSDPTGNPFSDTNPSAVAVQPRQITWIERSAGLNGSITGINTTSQQLLAANASRKGFFFQNLDSSNFVYLSFGTTPAVMGPGSIVVPPYSTYETTYIPTTAVYVIGTGTGTLFTCKENN